MNKLIVALAVVAFLYFGFVDDSLLESFGPTARVTHVVQKEEVPTFADEVWWLVFWWTPLVILAGAGAGGCWWILGKARKHWRLIEAENGVFPVAQVNTATWSQWWKGIKQISYVPVDMIGQEAATITSVVVPAVAAAALRSRIAPCGEEGTTCICARVVPPDMGRTKLEVTVGRAGM